ncbi:MAG: class I SAM-dependent methyltransferase [Candidatus Riflebacteria bacterium]|nr:class I SAM-dependent methyltransferase [Candidatus Riflebacteria bacterium]
MKDKKASAAIYVFLDPGHERKCLQHQAEILYSFTRRLFANAGISEGMRVLDVGSGAGDVAFLAAELSGPGGSVVGIDTNPSVLETARHRAEDLGYSNISFLAGDIRSLDLKGSFDAVVGRQVLLYLKDPAEAIRSAIRNLNSGGIVAFLEIDLSNGFVCIPPSPLLEKMRGWLFETWKRARVEMQMGLKLRKTFMTAGLTEPNMQCDAIIGGGNSWEGYKHAADTIRSMLPVMTTLGVTTADEVDIDTLEVRFRREIADTDGVAMLSTWIGAWSRKS